MCDMQDNGGESRRDGKTIPVNHAVGMVLAHDITEIRAEEFKGRAFKKGHIITKEDICHLRRLGKERLFVMNIGDDEMHEDDAACVLACALMGEGVKTGGEPKEGKINIIAERDGLLKIREGALKQFNMVGEVMCATLHTNTVVKAGQVVAGTRAVPLVVKKSVIAEAVAAAESAGRIVEVKELRKPKAGVVITGNEIYYGRIKDSFAPIIKRKLQELGGEIIGTYYAPDDESFIKARLKELLEAGADLLITTGGMSVDPDDVTRFAIRNLGAGEIAYGSAVLPGSMVLVAYLRKDSRGRVVKDSSEKNKTPSLESSNPGILEPGMSVVPILGVPACGMYHRTTVFDLVLPRILAGEVIGRRELAELGHGGLCLNCPVCRYPVCPFGK